MVNRRKVLATIGGLGTAAATLPYGVHGSPDNRGANGNAPKAKIAPFGDHTVSTGERIEYAFMHSGRKDLTDCEEISEQIFEVRDYKVELADRTIGYDDSDQYWSDCHEFETSDIDGPALRRTWSVTTQPLPPGEYDIGVHIRFNEDAEWCPDPNQEVNDDCRLSFDEGEVQTLPGSLTVEAGGRGNK